MRIAEIKNHWNIDKRMYTLKTKFWSNLVLDFLGYWYHLSLPHRVRVRKKIDWWVVVEIVRQKRFEDNSKSDPDWVLRFFEPQHFHCLLDIIAWYSKTEKFNDSNLNHWLKTSNLGRFRPNFPKSEPYSFFLPCHFFLTFEKNLSRRRPNWQSNELTK